MKKLLTIILVLFSVPTFAQYMGGSNWYVDRYFTKAVPEHLPVFDMPPRYYFPAVTPPINNNSAAIATTEYVDRAVSTSTVRMITLTQYFGSGTTTLTFPHGLTGIDSGFNVVTTPRAYQYSAVRYVTVDAWNFYVHLYTESIGETFSFSFAYSPGGSNVFN